MAEVLDTLPLPSWRVFPGLADYAATLAAMESHVNLMADGKAGEEIWLLEHPALITAGTSTDKAGLLQPDRFPVFQAGRGGQFTYHGPGQRVIYPMLDLAKRGRDVRRYVAALEGWAIAALADLGVSAGLSTIGTGIWVPRHDSGIAQDKIGAIGVRVRRWISFHGMALNISTDLSHFEAIVPCGIVGHGVTRLVDHIDGVDMEAFDKALFNRLSTLVHLLSAVSAPRIKTLEAAGDCS